jgi:Fur family transcriptional regulator, ferric uptake regulator
MTVMVQRVDGQGGARPRTVSAAEGIVAKLRDSGGRITATRRVTIEVLLAGGDHRHLRAEDIAAEVRERLPDVAESTIYRTLAALEDLGVVTHVHLGHGPSTFHLSDQAHRHLVCRHCRTIDELATRLDAEYGFSISNEHFALVGECQACRSREP